MYRWCGFQIKVGFIGFLKKGFLLRVFTLLFDGSTFESMFNNLNFNIQHFDVKNISSKSKNYKNYQNHFITNNGVIWSISKVTKICDQGMESGIFVLRFEICTCGVAFKIRTPFYVFKF